MSLEPFVTRLVKNLVLEPESVKVRESKERNGVVLQVEVAGSDVGRLIGKDGRVISCVRQVVQAAGSKAGVRTFVRVPTE